MTVRFDYTKIEEKALPHFKGGEKELNAKMFADANNKILLGRLYPEKVTLSATGKRKIWSPAWPATARKAQPIR